MAGFSHYEPCPSCVDDGRDRARDNLARYRDGGSHCFSCGYHSFPLGFHPTILPVEEVNAKVLPADFTREVPARGWEWLLQWGLSWSYWTPFVGWSEKDQRLVFTIGEPTSFSMGRFLGGPPTPPAKPPRKWYVYGENHKSCHIIGDYRAAEKIVLVEDIISAHKVGAITPCIPLFGTNLFDSVITTLRHVGLPVVLWLDKDQDFAARQRSARLAMLTGLQVNYVSTQLDPKALPPIVIARTIS